MRILISKKPKMYQIKRLLKLKIIQETESLKNNVSYFKNLICLISIHLNTSIP